MVVKPITISFELDTVLIIVCLNVFLNGLHFLLFKIHDRYKYHWSETALSLISWLMVMLSWVMAARTPGRSILVEDPKLKEEIKK